MQRLRRRRASTITRLSALAVAATLVAVACQPPVRTMQGTYATAVITPDGADDYRLIDKGEDFVIVAPTTNVGGNLRLAVARPATPASVDQQSCVTWNGPSNGGTQPGIALRVRSLAGSTQAIMITNNVVYYNRIAFNVHLANYDGTTSSIPQIGSVTLHSVGADPAHPAPLPWRLCARVVDTRVDIKVWQSSKVAEPSWTDRDAVGSVRVPSTWVYAGQPGFYIAHLAPGGSTSFTAGKTDALGSAPKR